MSQAQDLRDFFNDKTRNNISVYLNYCNEMGYEVVQQKGVLIYGFGFVDNGFPSEVYFLQGEMADEQTLSDFINAKLSNSTTILFEVLFNHMRWRSPDLPSFLETFTTEPVTLENKKEKAKAIYCNFIFNKFYGNTAEFPASREIKPLTLNIGNNQYHVNLQQLPDESGLPVFLEKID